MGQVKEVPNQGKRKGKRKYHSPSSHEPMIEEEEEDEDAEEFPQEVPCPSERPIEFE